MEKTITPTFEIKKNGKRGKLTGYIGELRDGEMLIHSMEYSTHHDAEVALDALAFELLNCAPAPTFSAPGYDALEAQAAAFDAQFAPSTCCFCHKPHHPQSCPEMRALLFAPDAPQPDEDDDTKYQQPTGWCYICGCAAWEWDNSGPLCPDHFGVMQEQQRELIYPPLDVEFSAFGPEVA